MRLGVIAVQHESNTFLAAPTTIEHFRQDVLAEGEAIRERFGAAYHGVGGFFESLEEAGIEAVPVFAARAVPGGVIERAAFDELMERLFAALDGVGRLDGLLVAPHGAAVSEGERDVDGYWLSRVREAVDATVPIVCTLDPHANVSRRMIAACDATIAYRTNPHLDQRERGVEAARLLARTLRGEVRPVQRCALPPMAINIERQLTQASPCRELYAAAEALRVEPGVLSVSVVLGFPYADVAEMGSGCIVVADGDALAAQRGADRLAGHLWDRREAFAGELVGVDEALDAAGRDAGPVGLLDMGDNVGGGSPGDGTVLAHALHERRVSGALVSLYDPEAAELARAAGVGAKLRIAVGAKTDDRHGRPLEIDATVVSLHDGRFVETQPRHGGKTEFAMGPTAVVRSDRGMTVQLTSRRVAPFSLGQLTSCGLDPAAFRAIVIKGVHAPVAAYESVCSRLIRVNTPGVTTADMTTLAFAHRRRPMFPFERDATSES